MARTRLSPAAKAAIANASPYAIQTDLARFANGGATGWLSPGSTYPTGQLPMGQAFHSTPSAEIISAITVRGPLHCIDGWGFLGRSISALAAGNPHSARHFAYYAELRAALSILASQGIGNFNNQNACVDSAGAVTHLPKMGTHDMAWLALSHWSKMVTAFDAIAESIDVAGVCLLDIIKHFFSSPSQQRLGASIVRSWGFDLSKMQRDKFERESSSYRPNELINIATTSLEDIDFIEAFWSAFEPEKYELERFLLRSVLEQQVREITNKRNLKGRRVEYARIDSRIQPYVKVEFLERLDEPDNHPLQRLAASTAQPAPATAMISRAALLLKLATALVNANFKAASVDAAQDLEFWWTDFGARRGFWSAQAPVQPLSELWLDISDALQEARRLAPSDRFGWLSGLPLGLPRLCETDRIPLWSLCG